MGRPKKASEERRVRLTCYVKPSTSAAIRERTELVAAWASRFLEKMAGAMSEGLDENAAASRAAREADLEIEGLPRKVHRIYGLVDPTSRRIRYVGVTDDPERRIRQHVRSSTVPAVRAWVRSLAPRAPELVVLESFEANSFERLLVERKWIGVFSGPDLLNEAGNS